MFDEDRTRLLFGPYRPPALRKGDHALCLYRDADVVVYDWTIAPISWPLCYHAGTRAFGKGILVDEELARAVRQESATAIMHWWRVSKSVVMKWRKALGVQRQINPGSQRLIRFAVEAAASAQRGAAWRPEQIEHRRQVYAMRNSEVGDDAVYRGAVWTEAELALLGTMPDAEVAARLGRSLEGVRLKRGRMGIVGIQRQAG